jgi:uncharacterized protein (DUF362 family)
MGRTRRRFVRDLGALSVGLPLSASILSSLLSPSRLKSSPVPAKVVIVRDDLVLKEGAPIAERVVAMLGEGLGTLMACEPADALRGLLGGSRHVGLKVNCLSGKPLATRREVAHGLAGLVLAAVPDADVTIWDRSEDELVGSGYEISARGSIQCLATDSAGVGYEPFVREAGTVGSKFSRLLTERCDSVVSLAVLKDHGIAGISGCMKNFYGAIHNPNKYHPDGCNPYVADLVGSPMIAEKHKLSIVDGLVAVHSGGPGYKARYRWEFKGLVLGRDPVAVDRVCLDLIEKRRKEAGMRSLADEGRWPRYIFTACDRGVGESDLSKIDVIETGL